MRPTPAETLAGIAAILRTTVAPAIEDPHVRSQLHQVVTVLTQLQVDDPVGVLRDADAGLRALLASCTAWVEDDGQRASVVHPPLVTEPGGDGSEPVTAAHLANREALERFITELRSWRRDHGVDDSRDLDAAITAHLGDR